MVGLLAGAVIGLAVMISAPAHADPDLVVEPQAFRIVKRDSGPVNYYTAMSEGGVGFVRARYLPPWETAVLGYQVPDADRRRARRLRWSWRALALPVGGDECVAGKTDSAAVVYVAWKRGLRYYSLKYVWSAVGPKGRTCDTRRNPFVAQDTIIVESGGPTNVWRTVELDLAAEFRRHFEKGDPTAEVPDFVGIGLMSDGDQTRSESAADYASFVITR